MMHTGQKFTFVQKVDFSNQKTLTQFLMDTCLKFHLYHNFKTKKFKIIPNNLQTNKKINSFSFC